MIRSVAELEARISAMRRFDRDRLPYPPSSGGLARRGDQSKILIEYYGGPSTGTPEVKYIQLLFRSYKTSARWSISYETNPLKEIGSESEEFLQKHYAKYETLIKEVDIRALFNELYRGAMVQMVARLPVYAAVINRFKLVENRSAGTLYVTFNPIMLAYEIHYNPSFIVETMVQHAFANYFSSKQELYDELTGYTALMFSHEMEHVLRANLGAGGQEAQASQGADPELANLVSDSLINQRLAKVYMTYTPTVGIVKNLHTTFVVPKEMVGRGDVKLYDTVVNTASSSFKGVSASASQMNRSRNIIMDSVGKITTIINEDLIEYYKDNSNELTKDIDKFFRAFSGTLSLDDIGQMLSGAMSDLNEALDKSSGSISKSKSVPAPNDGSRGGDQQDGGSGSSSGSSNGSTPSQSANKSQASSPDSSNGEGSDNSIDGNQSGGQGSDSSSKDKKTKSQSGGATDSKSQPSESNKQSESRGGGSGQSGSASGAGDGEGSDDTATKSIDSMTDAEKVAAKSVLNSILDGAEIPELTKAEQERVESIKSEATARRDEDTVKKVMASADQMVLQKVSTGSTVATWRRNFSRLLAQCLGIKEVYSNDVPSARIEGAFGREEEVPDLKTLVLAIDCSGSMGPEKFKKIIKEIEVLGKAINSNSLEIKVVYWGSRTHFYKTKGTKGLMSKIQSNSKDMGGTNPNVAFDLMRQKAPRFDACIFMTDGEFFGEPTKESKAFVTKNKRKILWVLTPDGRTKDILGYDPSAKQRIIKQK